MTADLDKLSDRELDALFAEKVLGFEVESFAMIIPRAWQRRFGMTRDEKAPFYYMKHRGGYILAEAGWGVVPAYTRSLDAAWEGVEKLVKDKSCYFELSLWCNSKGELDAFFYLNFPTPSTDAVGASKQKSPARAVVLACLKAVS